MEAIYKVIFKSGGYDYEKYYTAKGLENEFFIHCVDEFLAYYVGLGAHLSKITSGTYATFKDLMKDVRTGGKWEVDGIYYDDDDDVLSFSIEKISIINS